MGGATRISLLILMFTLCGLAIYSHIRDFHFDPIFSLFKDIMLLVAGSFFTKSATQNQQNTNNISESKTLDILPG